MKVAVITPIAKEDYLTNTILDGLAQLVFDDKQIEYKVSKWNNREDFIEFARQADLIIFCWGKTVKKWKFFTQINTDYKLAEEIGEWGKTVFLDGSELGGDRRYTQVGKINEEMLKKCVAYFRREKPYPSRVMPLPFGIERNYVHWHEGMKKDVDFFCVFGSGTYAPLRSQTREEVKRFCEANNFTCVTERMPHEEFLKTLARSKVGVSVGGGGYDTARFWEILANNCLLMTETIDIYPDNGASELNYSRITQFKNLGEFKTQLAKMGKFLRAQYPPVNLDSEYQSILSHHFSRARVESILTAARSMGIIV